MAGDGIDVAGEEWVCFKRARGVVLRGHIYTKWPDQPRGGGEVAVRGGGEVVVSLSFVLRCRDWTPKNGWREIIENTCEG